MTDGTRFLDFGGFRLDRRERLLYAAGEPVALPPKAVDLLIALTDEPGALRSKEELLARVWPDVVVDEANLSQNIFLLRKALDDDGSRWIVTVPRRGYRFAGAVTPRDQVPPARSRRWWPAAAVAAAIVVIAAIAWFTRRHAGATIRTIAVLPFHSVDGNRDDRILQLGMADTLIIKLSQLSGIIVTPAHAMTPYLDARADPLKAGRDLGVNAIVDGNFQRAGHRIRCSVRLLRVDDGSAVWADQYDEDDSDVFDLEDRIANRVVSALDLRLTPQERSGLAKRYTNNRKAYELYLRGRLSWQTFEKDGLEASIRYFNAAIQEDPNYALAYAGIGKSYSVMTIYGMIDETEGWMRCRDAAVRALELDPQLSEPHTPLAAALIFHDWNWRRADEETRRAIDLDPASDAHTLRGYVLQAFGRPAEGLAELKRVHELDPFWGVAQNDYVIALYLARRYDDAIREGMHMLETQPRNLIVRYTVGKALTQRGRIGEAAQLQQQNVQQMPGYTRSIGELGVIAALRGDREGALARAAQVEALRGTDRYRRTDIALAQLYTAMGDRDAAFRALDAAYRVRAPFLWQVVPDPSFDGLRSDPRYAQLLAKMNLGR